MKHRSSPLCDAPTCPGGVVSRRDFLKLAATASATAAYALSGPSGNAESPPARVPRALTAIAVCKRYDYPLVRRALAKMLNDLGEPAKLVKNKFVTVKLNLVNTSLESVGGIPLPLAVTVHPVVALALGSLLVDYGAKQITFCDQLPFADTGPEAFRGYGYDFQEFSQTLEGRVRFVNTRNKGSYKNYDLVKVPGGGLLAGAWEVNKTYTERDVLISLTKMKDHVSAGITMGMKNLFGVPPSSLYGDDLKGEPDENAIGYRSRSMHECTMKPATSTTTFTGPSKRGEHGYNVPRFIVDLATAFPIDLVVADGISAIQCAEGWWLGSMVTVTSPGLLIAGRNPVCADATATAAMGFNPDADDFTPPFANGSNYLRLARQKGLGENRISELEVCGIGLDKARYHYLPTYQRPRA